MKILRAPMRSIVAVVAIFFFPQLSRAVDEEALGSQGAEKKAFTPKECIAVVKKVQESGRYTEESIVSICNEEMRSERCEFFAEALSLASSHADFKNESFCQDMEHAQFCSEIMDKLLESTAVSDLAFGECERAKPQHDEAYCRKIQQMLGYSVKNEDMDTMRACYMMEAYTNFSTSKDDSAKKELETSQDSPKSRIITGSSKELDTAGKGKGSGHTTTTTTTVTPSNIGRPEIVLQPVPLENFGKGKGKMVATEPAAAAPAPAPVSTIIVEPIPAPPSGMKVAAPAAASTILAEPIPQAELQKQTSKVSSPMQNPAVETLAFTISQHAPAIAPSQVQTAAMPQVKAGPAIAQPTVAHAEMQNGTLVMTGAAFGTVEVAKHGIEETLKKQVVSAVAAKQVSVPVAAINVQPGMQSVAALPQQVVAVVPITALQSMQIPSTHPTAQLIAIANAQVATPQTQFLAKIQSNAVAQPQVVQAVLQTVAGNVAQPLVQLTQQPNSRVVETSVSPATPPAVSHTAVPSSQAVVPVQPVAQPLPVPARSPVQAQTPIQAQLVSQVPAKGAAQVVTQVVPMVAAPPVQAQLVSQVPAKGASQVVPMVAAPQPQAQVVQPLVQAVARPVVQVAPALVVQPVVQPVARPVVQATPAQAQVVQPTVQPVSRPVVQATPTQLVQPALQPVSRPTVQAAQAEVPKVAPTSHIVQAIIVSSLAPVPQTQAISKTLPPEVAPQKNAVTKPSTAQISAVPATKDKPPLSAPARQTIAAPVQGQAALRTVSQHPVAGLAQKHLQKTVKVAVKVAVKKEKSDYSGFLSKFVAF